MGSNQFLIQAYDEKWPLYFQKIKLILQELLPITGLKIEHVGSTAVKNLAAKPIIDIDICFEPDVRFEDITKSLGELGYYHNGNQGIQDRETFKRLDTNTSHYVLDSIKHHLYVCPIHSKELKRHLSFRDYLRTNSNASKEYEQLKYEIALQANQDRKVYAQLKEVKARAFIESVLEKAIF